MVKRDERASEHSNCSYAIQLVRVKEALSFDGSRFGTRSFSVSFYAVSDGLNELGVES